MHSYTLANYELRKLKKYEKNEYPKNINLKNFNYFLWAPTLCYETEYPKIPKIRYGFLFRKLM